MLSYRPGTSSLNSYLRHLSGSHIAGPALLVIGLILLAAGLALHTVARRLQQTEPSAAEEGENHVKTTPPQKKQKNKQTRLYVSVCRRVGRRRRRVMACGAAAALISLIIDPATAGSYNR